MRMPVLRPSFDSSFMAVLKCGVWVAMGRSY
jgi:hypothetical protein